MSLLATLFPPALPVLKPLPPHVRDLHLDLHALALHISGCDKPSPSTVTGWIKPSQESKHGNNRS